jgi:hypothetical protein
MKKTKKVDDSKLLSMIMTDDGEHNFCDYKICFDVEEETQGFFMDLIETPIPKSEWYGKRFITRDDALREFNKIVLEWNTAILNRVSVDAIIIYSAKNMAHEGFTTLETALCMNFNISYKIGKYFNNNFYHLSNNIFQYCNVHKNDKVITDNVAATILTIEGIKTQLKEISKTLTDLAC